jgi:hypothetical protein
VDARPVLWDKTDDIYKDRIETKKAWREVCISKKSLKPFGPSVPERGLSLCSYSMKSIEYIVYKW